MSGCRGCSGLDIQSELIKANILIPIIFMTGHGDIPMSVKAMKAGAIDFLTKPFRDQDMLDAVVTAIERDRGRRKEEKEVSRLRALFGVTEFARAGDYVARHRRPDEQAGSGRGWAERDHSKDPSRQRNEEDGGKNTGRSGENGRIPADPSPRTISPTNLCMICPDSGRTYFWHVHARPRAHCSLFEG